MKVLGIDPGTATTGYGVIENKKGTISLIEYGCITTSPHLQLAERLAEIHQDLTRLIQRYRPRLLAVESVFFYKNIKTAIAVAQARGIVLLCANQSKVKLVEFTPLEVKRALTNYGRADKRQIQSMVARLLELETIPKPDDAADALAIAICAAYRNS